MYISLLNYLKALFQRPSSTPPAPDSDTSETDHIYIHGDPTQRSPCPGLNALANQGYLPRSGRNLTPAMCNTALETALHMSPLCARSLSNALGPLLRGDGTFDLVDTRKHIIIEHDASLTRLDFRHGDNHTFQRWMLEDLIRDAQDDDGRGEGEGGGEESNDAGGDGKVKEEKVVTLRSLARTFRRRQREARESGAPKLSWKHWFICVLQVVEVMNTAMTGGILTRETLEAVFVEERFPDYILDNPEPRTVLTLLGKAVGMLWWCLVGP